MNTIKHSIEGFNVIDKFNNTSQELAGEADTLVNVVGDITQSDWMGKDATEFMEQTKNFQRQMQSIEQAYGALANSYKNTIQRLEDQHDERISQIPE